jgi:hypothetical protein
MEKSTSVEDFIGGLLRMNNGLNKSGSLKMPTGGMGQRTDSEAAFQVRSRLAQL